MKQFSLRIAMVALCAMTFSAAVCRAQIDDTPPPPGTSGTGSGQNPGGGVFGSSYGAYGQGTNSGAYGQGTNSGAYGQGANSGAYGQETTSGASSRGLNGGVLGTNVGASDEDTDSSEAEKPLTAAPAKASLWTAGETSFKSNGAGWGGKKADFGLTGEKSWTSESSNFAEGVQPGGIWHEQASPLPVVKPAAAESIRAASTTNLLLGPRTAHPGIPGARRSRRARMAVAPRKQGVPGTNGYHEPGSSHPQHYGQSIDSSGSETGTSEDPYQVPH